MNRERLNRILTLASAGMILCWFDVLNSLVMPALSRAKLPVTHAALILAWVAFVSAIVKSWSLRRIGIIALHNVGFNVALILVLQSCGDPAYPFYDFSWITHPLSLSWAIWQLLTYIINMILTGLLYYCGYHLYRRKLDFTTISDRLDIGISAFLVVLIVKLIAEHKGVAIPYEHSLVSQLVCFMMLGLFSMGVARNQTSNRNSTISYFKGAGMVLSFGLLAAVFGVAMVMLFLPDLIEGALWGKEMLGRTWPYIEYTATLIAKSKFIENFSKAFTFKSGILGFAKALPGKIIEAKLNLFYVKVVLVLGLFYGLAVLWIYYETWLAFVRKLLLKPEENQRKPGPLVVLRIMARRIKRIFLRFISILFPRRDPLQRIEQYYRLLQKWGAHSGLERAACETPNEYGARLVESLPGLAKEIDCLIVHFNNARYGGIPSHPEQFKRIREGWRRLRSPVLWPVRARLWLFRARV